MKAGLMVALSVWGMLTVALFAAWAMDVGANGLHYTRGDHAVWFALWGYHLVLLLALGAVAIGGWFAAVTA